eukprot:m.81702 g.81702  ORF g.81702 m.81702 type:complete len:75 (+) comp14577_c0_seq18:1905-2129(+)
MKDSGILQMQISNLSILLKKLPLVSYGDVLQVVVPMPRRTVMCRTGITCSRHAPAKRECASISITVPASTLGHA